MLDVTYCKVYSVNSSAAELHWTPKAMLFNSKNLRWSSISRIVHLKNRPSLGQSYPPWRLENWISRWWAVNAVPHWPCRFYASDAHVQRGAPCVWHRWLYSRWAAKVCRTGTQAVYCLGILWVYTRYTGGILAVHTGGILAVHTGDTLAIHWRLDCVERVKNVLLFCIKTLTFSCGSEQRATEEILSDLRSLAVF